MSHTVQRVNPLEIGDQLKRLFVGNERPEFPGWYDRAYPMAVREGAWSWVALDEGGRVVAHVAGFQARLAVRGRVLTGGLLCNLMADKEHRTFFPVVSAIKRAVKDLRAEGAEFIYTNPINPPSVATMKAAGLHPVGLQNRFLMMTGHANPLVHAGVGLNLHARRLRFSRLQADLVSVHDAVDWTVEHLAGVSEVTPKRIATVYPIRMEDFGTSQDLGYLFRDRSGRTAGAAIVRAPEVSHEAKLITLRCRALGDVGGCAASLGLQLRSRGTWRVNGDLMMGTPFAQALVRAGFIERNEPWTVVAAGYTDAGREAIAGLGASDLEKIDVD